MLINIIMMKYHYLIHIRIKNDYLIQHLIERSGLPIFFNYFFYNIYYLNIIFRK